MIEKICRDCKEHFEITRGEEYFYERNRLSLPNRCKPCREKNRLKKIEDDKVKKLEEIKSLIGKEEYIICTIISYIIIISLTLAIILLLNVISNWQSVNVIYSIMHTH